MAAEEREYHVTAAHGARRGPDPPLDGYRRRGAKLDGVPDHMIVRPLIRLKQKPAVGRFPIQPCERHRQLPRIVPANPAQDRTGSSGREYDPFALPVVVVERRRELDVEPSHGLRRNRTKGSPAITCPICEDLVRPVPGSPSRRCCGPDHAPTVLVLFSDSKARDLPEGLVLRDDRPHGPPIEACGRRLVEENEGWIRRGIVELRPSLDDLGGLGQDLVRERDGRAASKRPYGPIPNLTNGEPGPMAPSEAKADRTIAPRLPWDVRVQPHESRESHKVPIREGLNELRRKECRAHPAEGVRIVDAQVERHRTRQDGAPNKPGAPILDITTVSSHAERACQ